MLLPHMVCNALVAGDLRSGAGQQAMLLEQLLLFRTHYTPYAVITQLQSRDLDDGHISARNMLSRLQVY